MSVIIRPGFFRWRSQHGRNDCFRDLSRCFRSSSELDRLSQTCVLSGKIERSPIQICRSIQPCRFCDRRTIGQSVGVSVCPFFSLRDKLSPNCRFHGCSCAGTRFWSQRLKRPQSCQELVLELAVLLEPPGIAARRKLPRAIGSRRNPACRMTDASASFSVVTTYFRSL